MRDNFRRQLLNGRPQNGELQELSRRRALQGLAFLTVLPTVYIVQPVAVRALRWRGFVALVGVTALAAHLLVGVL